ncbi:Autophagy-specific gene 2 [Strongyloides ratti]|uniref:Autophagy-related protein 2 n=1 Tax=Strongyloides ratti TaxID=34506 RepID=A0A090KNW4_STRRB|nr:Autophagy-specific gene 2 [Strongyloides ratti]CEF59273.1 Autophagy-specific gene 2 [Strongyloides ratti]
MQTDLVNGTIGIKEIELNCEAINAILKELSLNIRIIDSYVGNISANIPWNDLNKSSCVVKVVDLQITINARSGIINYNNSSMSAQEIVTSMMESMISSKDLASNVMSDDGDNTSTNSGSTFNEDTQGKDTIAGIIELMMSRVQIIFENTVIRIETDEDYNETGVKTAIELEIERIEFLDQFLEEAKIKSGISDDRVIKLDTENLFNTSEIKKLFKITNVKIYTDIFTNESQPSETLDSSTRSSSTQDIYASAMGSFHSNDSFDQSHNFKSIYQSGDILKCESEIRKVYRERETIKSKIILVAAISGKNNLMRINLHNFGTVPRVDQVFNKKVDISLCLKDVKFFTTPTQLRILQKLATLVASDDMGNKNFDKNCYDNCENEERPIVRRLESDDTPLLEQGLNDCIEDDRASFISEHFSFGHRKFHLSNVITEEFSETSKKIPPDTSTIKHGGSIKKNSIKNRNSCEIDDSSSDTITRYGSTTTLTEKKPDLISLKVDIHNLQGIITHKDPLSLESIKNGNFESVGDAINQISEWSKSYFDNSTNLKLNLNTRMKDMRETFNDLYKDDHLRFVAATTILSLFCEKQSECDQTSLRLSIFNCELIEYLSKSSQVDKETDTTISLLTFDDSIQTENEAQIIIDCRIGSDHKNIDIGLLPCKIEFDLSIIDRLSNLICTEPFYTANYDYPSNTSYTGHIINEEKRNLFESTQILQDNFLSALLKCDKLTIDFRFPKADLRDIECDKRTSYNIRHIYDDYLRLELKYLNIELPKLSLKELSEHFCLHISSTSILGNVIGDLKLFDCTKEELQFLYAFSEKEEENVLITFNYDIRNKSLQVNTKEQSDSSDNENQFFNLSYTVEGPFTHKKSLSNNEIMIMPGDRNELYEFSKKSNENALMNISIFIPNLRIIFPSKKFYEILYNRFGNDIALWEPSAPCYNKKLELIDDIYEIEKSKDNFQPCRNGMVDLSYNGDDNNGYDSNGYNNNKKKMRLIEVDPHKISIVVTSKNGNILICHKNNILMEGIITSTFPSTILLNVDDLRFFYVHGYYGKVNNDYSYVTTTTAKIYHLNNCNNNIDKNVINNSFASTTQGTPLLVKFEPINVNEKLCPYVDNDSFTLSMKLQVNSLTSRSIILAIGLRNSTLHFEPLIDPINLWINQLVDFFTVEDYAVPGYVLPDTTIELHSNIESVVIAHEQRNIISNSPYEIRFAINSCSIQSKIIQNIDILQFNCIIEDSSLFMRSRIRNNDTDFDPNEYIYRGTNISQILNEFAKILSCGHLKLQLSLSIVPENTKRLKTPLLSVVCSNDNLDIWVCSDTLYIFLNVITEIVEAKINNDIEKKEREEKMAKNVTGEDLDKMLNNDRKNSNITNIENDNTTVENDIKENRKTAVAIEEMLSDAIDYDTSSQKNIHSKLSTSVSFGERSSTSYSSDNSNNKNIYSSDDDFCDLTEDIGTGITDKSGEAKIRHLAHLSDGSPMPIVIVEDYFTGPPLESMNDPTNLASFNFNVLTEFIIEKMSISINIYGGSDFGGYSSTQKSYSSWKTKRDHSCCFKEGSMGGPYRDHTVCVAFCFDKISFMAKKFSEPNNLTSMVNLSIRDFYIEDHLIISEIDKMLHKNVNNNSRTQSEQSFITFKMIENHSHEAKIRMSLVPMKLNIDQDSLNFIIDFITDVMKNVKIIQSSLLPSSIGTDNSDNEIPTVQLPLSTSHEDDESKINLLEKKIHSQQLNSSEPLVQLTDNPISSYNDDDYENNKDHNIRNNLGDEIFIKTFTFTPECNIKIDYNNKRLISSGGTAVSIAMGLTSLKGSEITLKEIKNKNGVLGVGRCIKDASDEWYADIYNNQLTKIIKGYGPTSPFINMLQGIRDLFVLPVEEIYKVDGHIVKGIKSGASSFGVSAATAVIELGQSISNVVQSVAEFAFDIVHPDHINPRDVQRPRIPGNLREGIHHAYDIIKSDIKDTARHIQTVTSQNSYENNSTVLTLARTAAPVFFQPVICTAKATKALLDGVKSELQPDEYAEGQKKWKNQNK